MSRSTIIIGGGAGGTLVAIHLLHRGERVTLVERSRSVGAGTAYSTNDPAHLLNVPASRMSCSSANPGDFVSWLQRRRPGATGASLAPRALYGRYLADSLAIAARSGTLELVAGDAVALSVEPARVNVALDDGRQRSGAAAVLALGNPAPANPPLANPAFFTSRRYVADPWADGALERVESGKVILIGSGLTAVDVALSLAPRPVHIELISRHGLLPRVHASAPVGAAPVHTAVEVAGSLSELFRAVRTAMNEADDWRTVVDSLRSSSHRLWQSLGTGGQEQFLRHVASHWNIHRHRMAPEAAAVLDALRRDGRLALQAGRLTAAFDRGDRAEVHMERRGATTTSTLHASHVVNCTGPRLRLLENPAPLVLDLERQGLCRPDPHRIGVETTEDGALVDASGTTSRLLFAVGTLRRGTVWESNAIPELRAQAEALPATLRAVRPPRSAADVKLAAAATPGPPRARAGRSTSSPASPA